MKVGDYVRTKQRTFQPPQIARIRKMEKDSGYKNQYYIELDHNLIQNYEYQIYEEDVDKSSPNIIDLIEVGDYVNGHKVLDIYKDINEQVRMKFGENGLVLAYKSNYDNYYLFEEDIKSIVTKEQFESMEYKIGE